MIEKIIIDHWVQKPNDYELTKEKKEGIIKTFLEGKAKEMLGIYSHEGSVNMAIDFIDIYGEIHKILNWENILYIPSLTFKNSSSKEIKIELLIFGIRSWKLDNCLSEEKEIKEKIKKLKQ